MDARARAARSCAATRETPQCDRGDGLRDGRGRRAGDAGRRAPLPAEAARRGDAARDGARGGASGSRSSGTNRELHAALDKAFAFPGILGETPAMQRVFDVMNQVRRHGRDGADPRRVGHGQGARRAGAPPLGPAAQRAVRRRSTARRWRRACSRASSSATSAARSRARVARRKGRFEAARRRDAVPRRGRRHAARDAGEAPARARVGRGRARREQRPHAASTCASSPRRTATSRPRWRTGQFREDLYFRLRVVDDRAAAAARAPGRPPAPDRALPRGGRASGTAGPAKTLRTEALDLLRATAGRATSASCRTCRGHGPHEPRRRCSAPRRARLRPARAGRPHGPAEVL